MVMMERSSIANSDALPFVRRNHNKKKRWSMSKQMQMEVDQRWCRRSSNNSISTVARWWGACLLCWVSVGNLGKGSPC